MASYWCRYCGQAIAPHENTLPYLAEANRYLIEQGEQAFLGGEVLVCRACYPTWQDELTRYGFQRQREAMDAARKWRETQVTTAPDRRTGERDEDR